MSKNKEENCPLCKKHCPLENPQCKKGVEYSKNLHESADKTQEVSKTEEIVISPKELTIEWRLMELLKKSKQALRHIKGYPQGQGRILSLLLDHGSMTQRKLLDYTDIKSSSLSELISKLKKDGYIIRIKSDEDKRNREISLTPAGILKAQTNRCQQNECKMELFSMLTDEEKQQLELTLTKLLTSWIVPIE